MAKYNKRYIDKELQNWAKQTDRKPLLLRGARQVGKTTAVRHLSEQFDNFAEVDFNERPDIHYMFDGTYSPQEICNCCQYSFISQLLQAKPFCFSMRYKHAHKQLIV